MQDDFIEGIEARDMLERAMEQITDDEKQIIERVLSGMTLAESAKAIGISKSTAYSRKESALKKMRYYAKKFRTNQ